jgi:hypothetical protein
LNKIVAKNDLENLKKYEELLWRVNPLGTTEIPTEDAKIKWSSIIESILHFKINETCNCMVDAGCGPSNLSLIIKTFSPKLEKIFCIDKEQISHNLRSSPFCNCAVGDFFDVYSRLVGNEQVDLIVDACSVTHFDVRSVNSPNEGCYRLAKEAVRTLKKGGYYITSSDFSLDNHEKGEFISVDAMTRSYLAGGLKLVGSVDMSSMDNAYVANKQLNLGIVTLIFQKA